jgi:hypothetical protein
VLSDIPRSQFFGAGDQTILRPVPDPLPAARLHSPHLASRRRERIRHKNAVLSNVSISGGAHFQSDILIALRTKRHKIAETPTLLKMSDCR